MDVGQRLMDRLHAEALIEHEEREWERTWLIPCSDCGTVVRTPNLETLPPHNCTERQRRNRQK